MRFEMNFELKNVNNIITILFFFPSLFTAAAFYQTLSSQTSDKHTPSDVVAVPLNNCQFTQTCSRRVSTPFWLFSFCLTGDDAQFEMDI